jgi:hypothetical protein
VGRLIYGKILPSFGRKALFMKITIAAILCVLLPLTAFAGDNSYKVSYDGGSVPDLI